MKNALINSLLPKGLQAADSDLYNPFVPKAHNIVSVKNKLFHLRMKPANVD